MRKERIEKARREQSSWELSRVYKKVIEEPTATVGSETKN